MKLYLWKSPKYKNSHKDRGVTLLELFFDISIVVMLTAVSHALINLLTTPQSFTETNILFLLFFSILQLFFSILMWREVTFYTTNFNSPSLRHRLLIFSFIFSMLIMAMSFYVSDNIKLLIIVNSIGIIFILFFLWFAHYSIWRKNEGKYFKKYLFWIWLGKIIAILIVALALIFFLLFYDKRHQSTILIYLLVFLLSIITIVVFGTISMSNHIVLNLPQKNLKLLQERYGILLIVFLAESFIQSMQSIATYNDQNNLLITIIFLFLIFLTIFANWWIFNDVFSTKSINNRPSKITLFSFAMLFWYIGITFFGWGSSFYVYGEVQIGVILFGIGSSIILLTCMVITWSFLKFNWKQHIIFGKKFLFIFRSICLFSLITIIVSIFYNNLLVIFIINLIVNVAIILLNAINGHYYAANANKKVTHKKLIKLIIKEIKEEKTWIKKHQKAIDYNWHKQNKFRLNNHSYFINNENSKTIHELQAKTFKKEN